MNRGFSPAGDRREVTTNMSEEPVMNELKEKDHRNYMDAVSVSERRGELRGELRGKLEGLREGELKGKMEVARLMLADAMSPDLISKYTGLSAWEIESLR